MEGIPVLDPLEHSVLEMALNDGPLEEMSHLEPLEHSVLKVALDGRPMEGIPVLDPLQAFGSGMALDSRPLEEVSYLEPLEHSVMHVALDGRPWGTEGTAGRWWTDAWPRCSGGRPGAGGGGSASGRKCVPSNLSISGSAG